MEDWFDPKNPEQLMPIVTNSIQHRFIELIEDAACNYKLSAGRLMFVLINVCGGTAAMGMVVGGFLFNMPQAFSPAAVIFTGLAASDATVYFASKWADGGHIS